MQEERNVKKAWMEDTEEKKIKRSIRTQTTKRKNDSECEREKKMNKEENAV